MTSSPDTTDTTNSDAARAWVDVDRDALAANARTIAAASGSRLLPMVKANGYGLGAVEVARALEPLDPWGFGVATPAEGAALRRAGIRRPLLVATPLLPGWIDAHLAHDLRPTVGDPEALRAWRARSPRPFHVEIDTGMSRGGVRWDDAGVLGALGVALADAAGWEGIFTHFHSADTDPEATERQWARFEAVLRCLPRRPPLVHAANSAAAFRGSRYAGDLVRPGIFLYGGRAGTGPAPLPVAALRARVVAVRRISAGDTVSYDATWRADRETTVATLGIGYGDGFLRSTRPGSALDTGPARAVELGGRLAPLVGKVTMDMCMVAVPAGSVATGEVATIYGGLVSLDQQAEASGTISYELLTAIAPRVPRCYHGGGRLPA